ncbi:hypothetical protein [Niveibacterium sp. COAC-50]|uniref:hypothetical protein n=1 Tax=Niveibacterium sp. COAC-50 TaxID=2729384 RepID=UPI001554F1C8|nr:hypothetical protein [Niveibacterium sp. COAC-50]
MMVRRLAFATKGNPLDLDELEGDHPLIQTQVLIACIEEGLCWVSVAKKAHGSMVPTLVAPIVSWFDEVEGGLRELIAAMEVDRDLQTCNCRADDVLYDMVDSLIGDTPDVSTLLLDETTPVCVLQIVANLSSFWIEAIRGVLSEILAVMAGDGEVLSAHKRIKAGWCAVAREIECKDYEFGPWKEDSPDQDLPRKRARYNRARADAKVSTIRETIEEVFGLPPGSVRLLKKDKSPISGAAFIGTLRDDWDYR